MIQSVVLCTAYATSDTVPIPGKIVSSIFIASPALNHISFLFCLAHGEIDRWSIDPHEIIMMKSHHFLHHHLPCLHYMYYPMYACVDKSIVNTIGYGYSKESA